MSHFAYFLLGLVVGLTFIVADVEAAQSPTVSEMQIIYDPDSVNGDHQHNFTFIASASSQLGECYYEVSFFDARNKFIGFSNGIPDLSNGKIRCNGTAYLSGIAKRYEFTWQEVGEYSKKPASKDVSKVTIGDFQWKRDSEPVGRDFRHEFSFKASGPTGMGQVYYEIAAFDSKGKFIGFTNGIVDLSSGTARSNGTAYFPGIAAEYEFSWQLL